MPYVKSILFHLKRLCLIHIHVHTTILSIYVCVSTFHLKYLILIAFSQLLMQLYLQHLEDWGEKQYILVSSRILACFCLHSLYIIYVLNERWLLLYNTAVYDLEYIIKRHFNFAIFYIRLSYHVFLIIAHSYLQILKEVS